MPANDKPDTKTGDTDKSSEPTSSTSTTDASTTEGAKAAGVQPSTPPSSAGGGATDPSVTRVQIEQAPAEPAVFYGEGGIVPGGSALDQNRPHVKAKYEPFEW